MNTPLRIRIGVFTVLLGLKRDATGEPVGARTFYPAAYQEFLQRPVSIWRGRPISGMFAPFVFERVPTLYSFRQQYKRVQKTAPLPPLNLAPGA